MTTQFTLCQNFLFSALFQRFFVQRLNIIKNFLCTLRHYVSSMLQEDLLSFTKTKYFCSFVCSIHFFLIRFLFFFFFLIFFTHFCSFKSIFISFISFPIDSSPRCQTRQFVTLQLFLTQKRAACQNLRLWLIAQTGQQIRPAVFARRRNANLYGAGRCVDITDTAADTRRKELLMIALLLIALLLIALMMELLVMTIITLYHESKRRKLMK